MQKDTHQGIKIKVFCFTWLPFSLFYYFPYSKNPSEASSMQLAQHNIVSPASSHFSFTNFFAYELLKV